SPLRKEGRKSAELRAMKRLASILITFILLLSVTVYAQGSPVCPPAVLLALARSSSTCYGLERNQACIGNGTVDGQFFVNAEAVSFAKPGDRADANWLSTVQVHPIDKGISAASLYTQASLTDAEQRSVAFLLLGDATIQNQVAPLPEMTAFAKGALNIRRTPETNGDIITRMAIDQAVIANGRSQAGDWVRMHVPDSNDLGWVSAEVVNPDGNILNLSVVGLDTPVYRPFQVFKLATGETTFCDGALPSGLLIQTPNATPADLTVNGVAVHLNGTF